MSSVKASHNHILENQVYEHCTNMELSIMIMYYDDNNDLLNQHGKSRKGHGGEFLSNLFNS